MSNPFGEPDDDGSGEILEGFLCPICREDLKSLEFLTQHFERSHSEEQDALKSIFKDIFSKAKKKIKLNFEDSTTELSRSFDKTANISAGANGGGSASGGINNGTSNSRTAMNVYNFAERQEVGADRTHFEHFKAIRDPRLERYASETNKLIIRLHKLLKDMPSDPVQRKQHEQNTVAWLDGSSVKLCPNCAKSFHLARRQHHCRLCGSIMCNDCSRYLPLELAVELASLTMSRTEPLQQLPKRQGDKQQLQDLRCCEHCLWLLETRKDQHDSRTCNPPIAQLYKRMQTLRQDVTPDIELYCKIVNSLCEGESIYTLAAASALRGKIGQAAEVLDMRSKGIWALPCEEGSRQQALQKSIRLSCVHFIKEKMLAMPKLPEEETIRKIQERKRMEAEQRILTERRLAMEAYERTAATAAAASTDYARPGTKSGMQGNYALGSNVHSLDNWSAHQVSTTAVAQHDDPLVEQINIIKGYIKQARQDMNLDVVQTLELNLRELQREFYERQRLSGVGDKQPDASLPNGN